MVTGWLEPALPDEPLWEPLVRVATGLATLPEPGEPEPLGLVPLACEPLARVATGRDGPAGRDDPPEVDPAAAGAACEPLDRVVAAGVEETGYPLLEAV